MQETKLSRKRAAPQSQTLSTSSRALPVTPLKRSLPQGRHRVNKKEVAAKRRAAHATAALQARESGTSFMEVNRVGYSSALHYDRDSLDFMKWVKDNRLESELMDDLDEILIEYFEKLYFDGESWEAWSKTLAALEYRNPSLWKSSGKMSKCL